MYLTDELQVGLLLVTNGTTRTEKKHVPPHIKIHQSFPILIESETGIQSHRSLWPLYTGVYNGDCVSVCNPDEMTSLYNMGFFGKGSFSRGYPTFELSKNGLPPFIYSRQWNRRKKWTEDLKLDLKINSDLSKEKQNTQNPNYKDSENGINLNSSESNLVDGEMGISECSNLIPELNECNNTKIVSHSSGTIRIDEESVEAAVLNTSKMSKNNLETNPQGEELGYNNKVIVVNDTDDDEETILTNPKVTLENELIKSVQETLHLSLEEAFFLSYALGCLQVYDWNGHFLSLINMWCIFCKEQSSFVENYVAYHYFRAKGWIVKPGYKFGGDLMLYKQGPPFYHASYVVLVESVKDGKQTSGISWSKLHGINRVAETAGKEIIFCQVFWPPQLDTEDMNSPQVLPRFKVNEILLRRWISSQERGDKE